jgi:hypothetical protein
LDEEVPEDEAQLLVSSEERWVAEDGGALASCSRWFSHREEKEGGDGGGEIGEERRVRVPERLRRL